VFKYDVEQSWQECDVKKVRPLRSMVFLRTHPPETMTESGLLHRPPSALNWLSGPAHLKIIHATVLDVGPKTRNVRKGDVVCFTRMYFSWWKKMEDRTMVGWIDESQLIGYPED
jgi:hypothetical protein